MIGEGYPRTREDVVAEAKSRLAWAQRDGADMGAKAVHASGTDEDATQLPTVAQGPVAPRTQEDVVAEAKSRLAWAQRDGADMGSEAIHAGSTDEDAAKLPSNDQ
jgi:hypothetical protein